jgi:hypothetical protein
MTDAQVRTGVGLFWIAAHLIVLATILVCYSMGGFEFDQMTTLLAVVIPMFAGVTLVVVRFVARHRYDLRRGRRVSGMYAALVWIFPVAFTIVVLWVVIGRATNRVFETFDQAKLFLGILEALFVTYVANLLAPLFGATPDEMQAQRNPET